MKSQRLTRILACLLILGICGLAIFPHNDTQDALAAEPVATVAAVSAKPAEPTELQRETFSLLREKFQGPMLDPGFKTLRKLVSDETYLDFLRQTHPTANSVETFEEFFQTALPQGGRYLPFWKKYIQDTDTIDAEALGVLHKLGYAFWHMHIRSFHGEEENLSAILPFLMAGNQNPLAPFARDNDLTAARLGMILMQMIGFAAETQATDAAHVKTFRTAYGQDSGLIWLALREPILLGQILGSFTETDIFRQWVAGEFHAKEKEEGQ